MLPSQPLNHGRYWWGSPLDYSRFAWAAPPPPPAAAEAAVGAAEGAAVHLASGAAGGIPPRGPWGGYHHHYYDGYGRYGRRWGRRPGGRLIFLLLGIGGTAWYFKAKEHGREYERRMIESSSSSNNTLPSGSPGQHEWGRGHCRWNQRYQSPPSPSAPVDHETPIYTNAGSPQIQPQATADDSKMAWGWKSWKERKQAREEAWKAARETYFQQLQSTPSLPPSSVLSQEEIKAQNPEMSSSSNNYKGEMNNLREVVERLWEEKRGDAKVVQDNANEKAKEYAREKLDKLSAALGTLRESLKKDSDTKGRESESEKKWV
ncbi:hypothetical protein I204_06654 [Kwoniella mangroviensis CBS 8886]|uniref:uncharacterized protein n=1 Tax=Kwoniella mangroviensis CBS 8507 TaxID=1296122 RepID=UPI00080D58BE|nr:uncharacterized protein I203_01374 [Kwoniella mangroviensis CBS 8507]OCF69515.1 hypothetical protein I203_01374 [Kwoniella mangroviensis CBS 8507]OCF72277.1 hypothetical protein I204_06654 [Kwoniella mangroviensis CBS 8886]